MDVTGQSEMQQGNCQSRFDIFPTILFLLLVELAFYGIIIL